MGPTWDGHPFGRWERVLLRLFTRNSKAAAKPVRRRRAKGENGPVVGPALPDGIWEVTPRPADALDDARISISVHRVDPGGKGH